MAITPEPTPENNSAHTIVNVKEFHLPVPVTPMKSTPESIPKDSPLKKADQATNEHHNGRNSSCPGQEAALPTESAAIPYKLIPLELSPIRPKRLRKIFDGYSPRAEYMYHDAVINTRSEEVTLSPHSAALFAFNNDSDIELNSISVDQIEETPDITMGIYHSSPIRRFNGDFGESPVPAQPLRKRGRPKKQPLTCDPSLPPRRGRGRPKIAT